MNIWTYWEGPKPDYIDLCLRSVQQGCGSYADVHIVTPDTLGDYIKPGTIHKNYEGVKDIAIRADCIRAALLAEHGGWWWDADTIVLGDRFPTVDRMVRHFPGESPLFAVWDQPPLRVLNGYIYMPPGCDEATEWLDRVNFRLKVARECPIEWAELGEAILTPLLVKSKTAWRVERNVFLPVDIDRHVTAFFDDLNPLDWVRDGTVCFGLNHSYFMYHQEEAMRRPWERGTLIHRLFRHAEAEL